MPPCSQGLSLPGGGERETLGTRVTVKKSKKKIELLDNFPKINYCAFHFRALVQNLTNVKPFFESQYYDEN